MSIPSAPPIERPRHTFTTPKGARVFAGDPASVTLSPLLARDEIAANRAALARGGGTDAALTLELCRRSVVEVNGKPIDFSETRKDDSVGPDWIDATSPQFRGLLGKAFMQVNRPSPTDEADFLASAGVEIG